MSLRIPVLKEDDARAFDQAHVFQQLLAAIEAVRIRRQEEYRERRHLQLKRFTQQELNDEVCPT